MDGWAVGRFGPGPDVITLTSLTYVRTLEPTVALDQPLRHWEIRHARARDQSSHCNFRLKVKRFTLFYAELFAKLIFIYPPLPLGRKMTFA